MDELYRNTKDLRNAIRLAADTLPSVVKLDPVIDRLALESTNPVLQFERAVLVAHFEILYNSAYEADRLLKSVWQQRLEPNIKDLADPIFIWMIEHCRALTDDELGLLEESRESSQQAVAVAERVHYRTGIAMSVAMYGRALARLGCSVEATLVLAKALELSKSKNRAKGLDGYYMSLLYEQNDDLENALRHCKIAASTSFATSFIGTYLVDLARMLGKAGFVVEATDTLKRAREAISSAGWPTKPKLRYILAEAHIALGSGLNQQAIEFATQASDGFKKGGFWIHQATATMVLAQAYLGLDKPRDAITALSDIEVLDRWPPLFLAANRIQSDAARMLGDLPKEVYHLRKVIKLANTLTSRAQAVYEMEEFVKKQADITQQNRDIEVARNDLDIIAKTMREGISMITHDLRGTLTVVGMWAEAADEPNLGVASIQVLQSAADSMRSIIDQLSLLGKVKNQAANLGQVPIDVVPILRNLVMQLKSISAPKGISVEFESWSPMIFNLVDEQALERIIRNFCMNAIRHSTRGSVIDLRVKRSHDLVRIWVQDQGPGIELSQQEKIFKKFVSTTGSGMGLFIARELAGNMNGQVGVESKGLGFGSTFWLTIPVLLRQTQQVEA